MDNRFEELMGYILDLGYIGQMFETALTKAKQLPREIAIIKVPEKKKKIRCL